MLRVLKAEILCNDVSIESLANALEVKPETLRRKLNEDISMSLKEIKIIKDRFFPDKSLDYLFSK